MSDDGHIRVGEREHIYVGRWYQNEGLLVRFTSRYVDVTLYPEAPQVEALIAALEVRLRELREGENRDECECCTEDRWRAEE